VTIEGKQDIHQMGVLRRKSEFGGMVVDDVAYGWKDVSVLCTDGE
jgi:hypothetical protein